MVPLAGIYTIRDTKQPYYWDIVFEWENELAKALNIPLIPVGKKYDRIYKPGPLRKILNRVNFYQLCDRFFFRPDRYFLAFHIGPPGVYSFHSRRDVIPMIIDFWKSEDLRKLESIFSLNRVVFVSSREVFDYLKSKNVRINLDHLALSLPDKIFNERNLLPKEFDLIQLGRQNEQLTKYVDLLVKEFPNLNYVCAKKIDGRLEMVSTRTGKLGEFHSRESFLQLLGRTKISLLSAPGLDDDAARTGGFSPVTPRFLESAACGCYLAGLYPMNADFDYYNINSVCENVKNYDDFKRLVLNHLRGQNPPDYTNFLKSHLTSTRAAELKNKLSKDYAKH